MDQVAHFKVSDSPGTSKGGERQREEGRDEETATGNLGLAFSTRASHSILLGPCLSFALHADGRKFERKKSVLGTRERRQGERKSLSCRTKMLD